MKLVDMKLPKKTKKELRAELPETATDDQLRYPWGLNISLEKESIEKLPILKNIDVEDSVIVHAKGYIKEISVVDEAGKGRRRHRIEIQLQKIAINHGSGHSRKILDKLK